MNDLIDQLPLGKDLGMTTRKEEYGCREPYL